jgi:hypothetical protein
VGQGTVGRRGGDREEEAKTGIREEYAHEFYILAQQPFCFTKKCVSLHSLGHEARPPYFKPTKGVQKKGQTAYYY